VHAALDDLVTTLYVQVDDRFKVHPERVPQRPKVGFQPKIADAELVTLAVIQVLLGYTSERRWLRHANVHLTPWFPYLPGQPSYNKRLPVVTTVDTSTAIEARSTGWTMSSPISSGATRDGW
jgi:hypothetical protein